MTETFEHIGDPGVGMVLNPPQKTDTMTVVIAGLPRGGTSMVAATVHALGVDLGPEEDLRDFHYEDQTMNRPYLEEQHEYIKARDGQSLVWGWKDPGALHPLRELSFALRNPRVIIVSRDPLSIIQGEMRFDKHVELPERSLEALIEATENRFKQNWDFVNRTKLPTMLVSYERAIQQPERYVKEVIKFLDLAPTHGQKQLALERISVVGGYRKW